MLVAAGTSARALVLGHVIGRPHNFHKAVVAQRIRHLVRALRRLVRVEANVRFALLDVDEHVFNEASTAEEALQLLFRLQLTLKLIRHVQHSERTLRM